MANLFKSPGVVTDPAQFQSDVSFLQALRAGLGVELYEIATPIVIANAGTIYAKDVLGIAELHYYDDAGNEVQITSGGAVPGVADLDAVADGVTYGRVLNTSLTVNEVTLLTDAAGDDLNVSLGGLDRTLTITANSAINQSVLTGSSPTFAGMTLTAFTGVLYAAAGVIAAGDLDNVPNGATYGKVRNAGLSLGYVTTVKTTSADYFTFNSTTGNMLITLGQNPVVPPGGTIIIDQSLTYLSDVFFSKLLLTKEVMLTVMALAPGVFAAGTGNIYLKTVLGIAELFYQDDAANEVQITSGGAAGPSMDTIIDGVTYGKVLQTSLSASEVVILTDAAGDDLTVSLGGADRVLTLTADIAIDQNLRTTDDVIFNSLTTTQDALIGRDCSVTRNLSSLTLQVGGGYGSTGFTVDQLGNMLADGNFWLEGDLYPSGLDLNYNDSRLHLNVTDVNSTPYSVVGTADCYLQDRYTLTAASIINLPSIATVGDGYVLWIKDSGQNANTNNITLVRNGADTIELAASDLVLTADGIAVMLVANATTSDWEIA